VLGVSHDLAPIRQHVEGFQPHVVFHLLMEFQDVAVYQAHVTGYLELLRVPYAGCNPRGLLLARDKALSKLLFRVHRIPTPGFLVFARDRAIRVPKRLGYPLIVKSVDEEASLGIAQASIVHDEEHLRERIAFVHRRVATDAIAEQYVAGRELTIGVLGNDRLATFPVWEMFFENLPEGSEPIATARVKWTWPINAALESTRDPPANSPRTSTPRSPASRGAPTRRSASRATRASTCASTKRASST